MISYLIDDSATAYYTVAYSISAIGTVIWTSINGSLIPFTYESCKKKDYAAINRVTLPILTLFAIACIGIILLGPEAVTIMAAKAYREAIYVIPPIISGVFFQVQYYIYANILYYYKKPKYVMIGSVSAVVLNILLNYYFIRKYGYVAAGYTTVVCYGVQAIIDYFGMRSALKRRVYNMKYIVFLSVMMVLFSLISVGLYDKPSWIRYGIIIAIFCILIVCRKRIIEIWENIKQ